MKASTACYAQQNIQNHFSGDCYSVAETILFVSVVVDNNNPSAVNALISAGAISPLKAIKNHDIQIHLDGKTVDSALSFLMA